MRPDRIIMGEVRRQREAEVLFEAMHTGHSVYCTLHADTCAQTITRLINPPINIPPSMLDAVHLNVVMFRDRRRGIRRVYEIGEFIQEETQSHEVRVRPSLLYRWSPREDVIKPVFEDKYNFNLLNRIEMHTGLTPKEIWDEIEMKKKILEWLREHNIRDINALGAIMKRYYSDSSYIEEAALKNRDPKDIIGEVSHDEEAEE